MKVVPLVEELAVDLAGPGSCLAFAPAFALSAKAAPPLFVGTRTGHLSVYSLESGATPLASTQKLGLLTSLSAGDLFRNQRPCLAAIAADGVLMAFRLFGEAPEMELVPVFKQFLPSNIQASVVEDMDGDGSAELLVALTDRIVRSYRYAGGGEGSLVALNKWEVPAQLLGLALSGGGDWTDVVLSQPLARHVRLRVSKASTAALSPDCAEGNDVVNDVDYVGTSELNISDAATTVFIPPRATQIFFFHSLVTDIVLLGGCEDRLIPLPQPIVGAKIVSLPDKDRLLVTVSETGRLHFFRLPSSGGPPCAWTSGGGTRGEEVRCLDVVVHGARVLVATLTAHSQLRVAALALAHLATPR